MKKMMRKIASLFLALTMIVLLVSCGNSGKDKVTVGISVPGNSLDRFERDGQYLKNQFEAAGYKVDLKYADDNEGQNKDIRTMISGGAGLLVVLAVDSDGLSETLAEAGNKKIPVVAYDRFINNSDAVTAFVSFDNIAVGTLQGNYIKDALDLDKLNGPFNIEFVAGNPGDTNARYYFKGAVDVLKPYMDSGKLVVRSGQTSFEQAATDKWLTENAKSRFETIISSFYADGTNLDAVLCSNDSTALGVTQALASGKAGKSAPIITGQDGDIANLRNIVDGKQAMTVYKNVSDEAKAAFEVSVAILNNKTLNADLAKTLSVKAAFDTETYTNGKDGVPSYLLQPYSVTAGNLDILVSTGLYEWDANHTYLVEAKTK